MGALTGVSAVIRTAQCRHAVRAVLLTLAMALSSGLAAAQTTYGSFGPEGPRMREQLWIVPGGDTKTPLRATLFRPTGAQSETERLPLVIINHGSDASTREAVAMPVFYWLSRWFVSRGYAVLVPQRRGHGATGGDFVEGEDSCARPDHYRAGQSAADDVEAAIGFMKAQPFVDGSRIIVAGTSTGGWASLAIAGRAIPGVRLIVNFAGGRGGHAYGRPHAVCARGQLIEATGLIAQRARVPTVWFYSKNDSFFGPELAASMAEAWATAGGRVDLNVLAPYGTDGHELVADRGSWPLWEGRLQQHLDAIKQPDGAPAEIAVPTRAPPIVTAGSR